MEILYHVLRKGWTVSVLPVCIKYSNATIAKQYQPGLIKRGGYYINCTLLYHVQVKICSSSP